MGCRQSNAFDRIEARLVVQVSIRSPCLDEAWLEGMSPDQTRGSDQSQGVDFILVPCLKWSKEKLATAQKQA